MLMVLILPLKRFMKSDVAVGYTPECSIGVTFAGLVPRLALALSIELRGLFYFLAPSLLRGGRFELTRIGEFATPSVCCLVSFFCEKYPLVVSMSDPFPAFIKLDLSKAELTFFVPFSLLKLGLLILAFAVMEECCML